MTTPAKINAARDLIARTGETLYDRRLAHGSAGNLSVRLEDGTLLLTPTNSSLGDLDPARLSHLAADGRLLDGDPPSKEAFFHLAVYDERPSARSVVHLHSTHCVAVSCLCHETSDDVLPPLTAYHAMRVGKLPLVPYFRPGDRALAEAVRKAAKGHHAMLLANHGPIVAGKSLREAAWTYEELEETAKLFFLLGDRRTRPLDAAQVAEIDRMFAS